MKAVVSDVLHAGLSHLVAASAQIALLVLAARHVSAEEYGRFAAGLAVTMLVEGVFLAFSGEHAVQQVGRHWARGDLAHARRMADLVVRMDRRLNWLAYGVIVVLAGILDSVSGLDAAYVVGLGLLLPAQIGYGVSKSVFIASGRLQAQARFEILFSLLQLALGLTAMLAFGITGLVGALVVSAAAKTRFAVMATAAWWGPYARPGSAGRAVGAGGRRLWRQGLHSVLRNGCNSAAAQLDLILLSTMAGFETAALYKAAKTLAAAPSRAVAPIWVALRPRLLHAYGAGDARRVLRLIGLPAVAMTAALVVAAGPAAWFMPPIVERIYGPTYALAARPCLVLLLGTWLYGAATAWHAFWVVISEDGPVGSLVAVVLLAGIVFGALTFGTRSAMHMALAVTGSSLLATLLSWVALLVRLRGLTTGRQAAAEAAIRTAPRAV